MPESEISTSGSPAASDSSRGRHRWIRHGMASRRIYQWTAYGCANLPLPVLHAMSIVGNGIATVLMRETLAAVTDNFRVAFGWDESAARRMGKRVFHSYGYNTIDLFRLRSGIAPPAITTFQQDEAALRRVRSSGHGCIIVTGHVGNWKMGAISLASHGVRGAVVGQPELDPEVHALRIEIRSRLGLDSIDIGSTMATAFRVRSAVENGSAVAMVADRAYVDDRVPVQFFGRTVNFLKSPALLARFCRCPLLPSFFLRNPDGTYRSFLGEPIEADPSKSSEEDARRMMQEIAIVVERAIREEPEQWFNFFRYWSEPLGGAPR